MSQLSATYGPGSRKRNYDYISRGSSLIRGLYRNRKNIGRALAGASRTYLKAKRGISTLQSMRSGSRGAPLVAQMGAGGQCTSYKRLRPSTLKGPLTKLTALNSSVWNAATQSISAVGKQQVWSTMSNQGIYTSADIGQLFTDVGAGTNGRIYLEQCVGSVLLSNVMYSNVTIDIYDIELLRDCGSASYQDAKDAWAAGDVLAGATSEYLRLGSIPTESDMFKQIYRVAKKTRVILGSGQQHKHHLTLQVHQEFAKTRALMNPYDHAGITYQTMIVHHGSPANDTVTSSQVSIGASTLNIVYEKAYTYRTVTREQELVTDHSGLSLSFTVAENVMNEGGSTIVANATA